MELVTWTSVVNIVIENFDQKLQNFEPLYVNAWVYKISFPSCSTPSFIGDKLMEFPDHVEKNIKSLGCSYQIKCHASVV